ncbi:MAG: hypothetical protein AABZ36_00465, partial [Nitrospirota bacterium]
IDASEASGLPHFRHIGPLYGEIACQQARHIGAVLWQFEGFLQTGQNSGNSIFRNLFIIKIRTLKGTKLQRHKGT